MNGPRITILDVARHRNGVSGVPFGVVRFRDLDECAEMIAVVFANEAEEGPGENTGYCAVLNLERLPAIAFGDNSYRGDHYEPALRAALAKCWPWAPCSPEDGIPRYTPDCVRAGTETGAQNLLLGPCKPPVDRVSSGAV
jgi:hypothetical protein